MVRKNCCIKSVGLVEGWWKVGLGVYITLHLSFLLIFILYFINNIKVIIDKKKRGVGL